MTDTPNNSQSRRSRANPDIDPFVRFADIVPQDRLGRVRVAMVGAGGIGAPAALSLAKMGVSRLTVWDFDTVGPENFGPQFYGPKEVNRPKVLALGGMLSKRAPWCDYTGIQERYTGEPFDADVVIAAVDSLNARKIIWSGIDDDSRILLVDPKMGAEVLTVHTVIPQEDNDWYPHELEGTAVEAVCTAKATFHCGMVAGAYVAQAVKAWLVGELFPRVEVSVDLRFMSQMTTDREAKKAAYAALRQAQGEAA
jgi:molybdopterin/thiamine biosynthesis adenylyltransferase